MALRLAARAAGCAWRRPLLQRSCRAVAANAAACPPARASPAPAARQADHTSRWSSARAFASLGPQRLMVAVDDSRFARAAFDFAMAHLRDADHLFVVTVPPPVETFGLGEDVQGRLRERRDAQVKQLLGAYRERANSACGRVSFIIGNPDAGHRKELVRLAKENDIDTVYVGPHGHGSAEHNASSRLPLGTVAEFVSRHAPCNVTLVKG